MNEKTKQGIGIGVGVIGVSAIGVLGYYFYDKMKKQAEMDKMIEEGEADIAENYKSRFTVKGSTYAPINSISNRFKVMETLGDKGVEPRGTKRLRVSGNIHRRTEGGYSRNTNNRNANFSDLEIPNNDKIYKERRNLDIW